jgi:hypothetical protein
MTDRTRRSFTAALITLAAGAAVSLPAAAHAADHSIGVTSAARGASQIQFDGRTVRTTGARVANQRVITFPASRTVVAAWDETGASGQTPWFALSLDGGASFAQVMQGGTLVRLKYAEFDPTLGEPAVPASLAASAGNELYLVQFASTPLDEMRREIEAGGGEVLRFLTDNTHIVRMPAGAKPTVAALPYVRWIGAYHPAYRLEQSIREQVVSGAPMEPARYSIECMHSGRGDQQAIADFVTGLGATVNVITPDQYRMEATLTRDQLLAVLQRNEVSYVDAWGGPGEIDMDVPRELTGALANGTGFPGLASLGFTGQGVRGEVFDTELRTTHQAFANRPAPLLHGGSTGSGATYGYHGTSTYAINFAFWTAQPSATGMVPDAEQGIFCYLGLSTQFGGATSRLTLNQQLVDPAGPYRAVYQSSSVGSSTTTTYTSISAEVDDYLLRTDLLSCQSQSNTNSTLSRPQAWAKNIVSVGGIVGNDTLARADDGISGASYGPAADGRVKPDVAHIFDNIFTATAQDPATGNIGDTYSIEFSGTSGATPITAGAFGLFFQLWHNQVFPGHGGASTVFDSRPHMTTAKAMMINAAYRYDLTTLPRARQGWGMPDLANMYNLANRMFIVDQGDPLTNATSRLYTVNVLPGEPVLSVTMTYPEPMGSTAGGQARVNDLSVRVTSPSSTVYWGNNGLTTSNFSTSGGVANTIDPVENVFIQNPDAGNWTVEVIATQVVQDAYLADTTVNVPYSLVVSGATVVTPPAPCYANCDGSTTVPFLNVIDFTCFLQKFAAGDPYANCDGSTTPPTLNVIDFTCFLQKFAAGCSAP